jgi:cellulose synthase/poly-beta-1,6-N-acetylglucosamine synthase-like glycosyltransferase
LPGRFISCGVCAIIPLTKQFAIEYACHFELLLPLLASLNVPVPLGGTSNHFRTEILRAIGAWDPHNVTEDADLGIRLARAGYTTGMISSVTLEEANCEVRNWITQRSRWLKGWLRLVNDFFVAERSMA